MKFTKSSLQSNGKRRGKTGEAGGMKAVGFSIKGLIVFVMSIVFRIFRQRVLSDDDLIRLVTAHSDVDSGLQILGIYLHSVQVEVNSLFSIVEI